jgi:hypothetical protein
MAAPTTTARGTPSGLKMPDGFSTKIAFALNATIAFWEKTVKPPGIDGGEKIETTTMHNIAWRTFSLRRLKTLTDGTVKAAWDPELYDDILAILNVADSVTEHFENGDTLDYYGAVQKFEPEDFEEGKFPMISVTIVATNQDPATLDEEPPVFTPAAGTDIP